MRQARTLAAFMVATAVLASTVDARAAPRNWEGTATVHLYPNDIVNPRFTGGGVATVNGSSGGIPVHLDSIRLAKARGLIEGEATFIVTDPEVAGSGLAAVRYVDFQGLTGTIGGSFTTGRSPGPLPVRGIVEVCLLSTACTTYIPLVLTQPTTVNGVPGTGIKGLGVGGLLTMGGYGGIRVSVQMAPWTIKTVVGSGVITTSRGAQIQDTWQTAGWVHGPVSQTASSTAVTGGMLRLVTPAQISSNVIIGFGSPQGRFGETVGSVISLTLRFIPEPEACLLLGAGLVGLGLLVEIRRRR